MRLGSVRLRLLVWNIVVLAVVLSGFLLTTHFAVRSYLLAGVDSRLKAMAERVAMGEMMLARGPLIAPPPGGNAGPPPTPGKAPRASSEKPVPNPGNQAPPPAGNAGPPPPGPQPRYMESRVRAYDTKCQPLDRPWFPKEEPWDMPAAQQALKGIASFSRVVADEMPLRLYTMGIVSRSETIGVVQVSMPLEELEMLLDSLTFTLLLLMPVGLLLAAAGGLFLTNRALKPVGQIAEAASQLKAEDLSQRLPVFGQDEFARLAATMNGMLDRVEEAFSSLQRSYEREHRFTADASHELRTPLTVIKANTSNALSRKLASEDDRKMLEAIDQAADSMQRLVEDLLLLARSEGEPSALNREAIAPAEVFASVLSAVGDLEKGPEVEVVLESKVPAIWGAPDQLARLVANLIENALRHTAAEGKVILSARAAEDMVEITLSDTGEGIAPEHLVHLGERFYRVEGSRSRRHGGAGLGLAICKSIVEAHGGTLKLESQIGEGTTVTLLLPKAE